MTKRGFVGKIRKYSNQFVVTIPIKKIREKLLIPGIEYIFDPTPVFEDKKDESN